MVNGVVRNGTTCQVKLLSRQSFPVVYASNVRSCSSSFTARLTVGRNPSPINRTVAFELIARDQSLRSGAVLRHLGRLSDEFEDHTTTHRGADHPADDHPADDHPADDHPADDHPQHARGAPGMGG